MKELKLKKPLANKLDRLSKMIGKLHYCGIDPNILIDNPVVAVVGTRKPTPYGKKLTENIVAELSRNGVVIVSGLAFGVDIIAHKTALDNNGITISVLPSGLKNIYPATHRRIAEQICENGALISEYSEYHQPRQAEFLERNRIIAALCDVVVIPEAAQRSGSLNTAHHAKKMGIPVCAVPGPVTSSMSKGTNQLIKSGEHLITEGSDILKLLNIDKAKVDKILKGNTVSETLLLKLIDSGINIGDILHTKSKLTAPEYQISMSELEINGIIKQDNVGNWYIA